MSRVSSKSSISPSASKGSNAIDLGKDSGVDMGAKSQTSVSSGGIGVTQEIGEIGGVKITGGVTVELSPIGINISGNPDYEDPSKSTISISGGAEAPGGVIGISGGVTINTSTGAIEGGSIGGEALGLGISISKDKGGVGLGISLQIPFTPIEIELGFNFPDEKKIPTPTPAPAPAPIPTPILPILPQSELPNANCTILLGISEATSNFLVLIGADVSPGYSVELRRSSKEYSTTTEYRTYYNLPSTMSEVEIARLYGRTSGEAGSPFIVEPLVFRVPVEYGSYYAVNGNFEPASCHISVSGFRVLDSRGRRIIDNAFLYANCQAFSYWRELKGNPAQWGGWQLVSHSRYRMVCGDDKPTLNHPPFPNPPPRKKMDTCCSDSIKLLREIHKRLGISKVPGKLPETIIQKVEKEGEMPAEPPQVPIEDFVDLLDWQFKRDDERWGQWEIQIDLKDSDLTKEGDQGKSIKFPNLAESIAELEGQMLSVMANVDALVAITTKNLVESGMARQEAIKGYLAAKAIIKYMAFKSTEIDVPVPMTFTAGAETISALIKESEGHIKGTDYVEKETLRDIFLDLLQAAAVIRAVHWQKIDSKSDTKSQLLNLLKGTVDLAGAISEPKKASDGEEKKFDPAQNFEDFIDSVEDGFRNTTGITDIQNPYGKTPDRRPRIRQIGDNISQAGGKD